MLPPMVYASCFGFFLYRAIIYETKRARWQENKDQKIKDLQELKEKKQLEQLQKLSEISDEVPDEDIITLIKKERLRQEKMAQQSTHQPNTSQDQQKPNESKDQQPL